MKQLLGLYAQTLFTFRTALVDDNCALLGCYAASGGNF